MLGSTPIAADQLAAEWVQISERVSRFQSPGGWWLYWTTWENGQKSYGWRAYRRDGQDEHGYCDTLAAAKAAVEKAVSL